MPQPGYEECPGCGQMFRLSSYAEMRAFELHDCGSDWMEQDLDLSELPPTVDTPPTVVDSTLESTPTVEDSAGPPYISDHS